MADETTIDGAGRVVIPSAVRRQLHLRAGTKLSVEVQGDRLVLEPVPERDAIAEDDGLLVATGSLTGAPIDHRAIRSERSRKLTGG